MYDKNIVGTCYLYFDDFYTINIRVAKICSYIIKLQKYALIKIAKISSYILKLRKYALIHISK